MDASSAKAAAAASAVEVPRRLYERGFEGWDVSPACYVTDYLVMTVGIACAFVAFEKIRREKHWTTLWTLIGQFAVFSLLQGVGSGFRGMTHHLLDTFMEEGHIMGKRWGAPHSEWLFTWLMALAILPLASSACLGTSLAYGEFAAGWIKLVKGLGVVVAVFEVCLCLSNQIDASGALSVYWGIFTSVLACFVVFRRGCDDVGLWFIFPGNVLRVVGYMVLISAPASCKMAGMRRADCPYPEEFNHNAVYHVFIAASVLAIYFGADAKFNRAKEAAYWEELRASQTEQGEKDRMCSLGW